IDYESLKAAGSMMGSGGMIVMDEDDCMVAVAQFYLDFTVEESCGKCVPCREGNKVLYQILNKITHGHGEMSDLDKLKNFGNIIKSTSLCGLGQTAPNPVLSTLDNFYNEYYDHVVNKKCEAKQCRALITYRIIEENCVGCGACKRVCPAEAISGELKHKHLIDQEICIKCGACIKKCRFNAIVAE
ncbi:MAG TPA: NADH-ubiquinone oxidoreductase-F iron-sulfur binding region domain-containing protein, partial [Clostridiales bacterium]|nr:NADH-ubiquinone oxidoreductase-F iron-sulfur binding region domain-containing protein [Clostridiales bacterium]